jgi:hypothetical protein
MNEGFTTGQTQVLKPHAHEKLQQSHQFRPLQVLGTIEVWRTVFGGAVLTAKITVLREGDPQVGNPPTKTVL